ncbi:hypothetical protein CDL15_Pgr023135 [Punica granatum]|uniref:Uncharacterized protein n=1 Tax=Punica granatum TaxID=22663 RepID=A0A218X458_PUNGR|nr:hypothetical protein CDL15_Pgr023135 [Punica granatum]
MAALLCDLPLLNHCSSVRTYSPTRRPIRLSRSTAGSSGKASTLNSDRRIVLALEVAGPGNGFSRGPARWDLQGNDTGESTRQQYTGTSNVINGDGSRNGLVIGLQIKGEDTLKHRAWQGEFLD